jgi:hypothetical protein
LRASVARRNPHGLAICDASTILYSTEERGSIGRVKSSEM